MPSWLRIRKPRRSEDFKSLESMSLEPRALLSTMNYGDFYISDGQRVSLLSEVGQTPQSVGFRTDGLDEAALRSSEVYRDASTGSLRVLTNEIVVDLRDGVSADDFFSGNDLFRSHRPVLGTPDQFVATLANGAGDAALSAANLLADDGRLDWAEPNFYQAFQAFSTNDPLVNNQWHLNNTGQFAGTPDADSDVFEAWAVSTGSPNVVIAIIDDAIQINHPDLAANIFVNAGEIANNGIDDDGNGWVDDVSGYDFRDKDNNPSPSPSAPHGTSVAGVAAAVGNNGTGVAGVAYSSKILPVRIGLGGEFTSDADIASAVYYAAGRTANGTGTWRAGDVLNNSWGGGGASTTIRNAFTWAGTNGRGGKGAISFIATGNNGASSISFPANLAGTVPGVIAVGASTDRDLRASYSNFGSQIDFLAPSNGGNAGITTTDRTGIDGYANGDFTNDFGGTSSATPLASGVGALMLSVNPNLTAAQVKQLLRASTDRVGGVVYTNGFNIQYGYGRLNALKAVQNAANPGGGAIGTVTNVSSVDVPKAIPDRSTVTSVLNVANLSNTIGDVNVQLTINHSYDADLDVFLTSPSGTRVELFTDVGGSGDNFTNTVLDDQSAVLITSRVAPFTGTFKPEGSLAAFNNQSPNGQWRLQVTDDSRLDIGTLISWSLSITTLPSGFGGSGTGGPSGSSRSGFSAQQLDAPAAPPEIELAGGLDFKSEAGGPPLLISNPIDNALNRLRANLGTIQPLTGGVVPGPGLITQRTRGGFIRRS